MACFLQNGAVIRDDVHGCRIPSIEKFKNIVDVENTWPLTFVEQWSLTEVTAELSTSCYAGVLMLRAMGLGGWMFNGMDPFSVLGASGNPAVPGLGFRFDADERWPYPNPTGLAGMWKARFSFLDAVELTCDALSRMPGIGSPRYAEIPLVRGVRMLAIKDFENYLLFYLERENSVDVIRVLHGTREIPEALQS